MKEFAPKESKFFTFRVDPFFRMGVKNYDRVVSPESVSIPFNPLMPNGIFYLHFLTGPFPV